MGATDSKLVCTSAICSGVMVSLFRSVSCTSVADGSCRGTYRSRDERLSARKNGALRFGDRAQDVLLCRREIAHEPDGFRICWDDLENERSHCPPDAQ